MKNIRKYFVVNVLAFLCVCGPWVVEASVIEKKIVQCDSEACQLLKDRRIKYPYDFNEVDFEWTWFILESIDSAKDSVDGSYTRFKGKTIYGTDFDVYVLWWLDKELSKPSSCRKWIEKNGNYNPKKKKYYHFSGGIICRPKTNLMTDVGCSFMNPKERKKGYF